MLDRIGRLAGSLVLVLVAAACAPQGELGPQHRPTGGKTPLPGADFAAYVEAARRHIAAATEAPGPPLEPAVVADRGPFELVPRSPRCTPGDDGRWRAGVLLIHEIGQTPYALRDLGERLAEACHLVRAVLLPGHGTVPGDLLEVDGEAWLAAVHEGVASFAGVAERVHLLGFGAGGTLALHHALFDKPRAGALVLIAPRLPPRPSIPFLDSLAGFYDGTDARARWRDLAPDLDPVRYESLPKNALREVDRLARELDEREGILDIPVMVALSAEDAAIDADAIRRWFCRRLTGPRQMLWYSADGTPITDCRFVRIHESGRAPGVLDYSHVALPVAPDNPRYGADAAHFDCDHYFRENSPNWLICVDPTKMPANSEIRYGEITPANLERAIVRRLTWNPDFEAFADAVVGFLAAGGRVPWPSPPRPQATQ